MPEGLICPGLCEVIQTITAPWKRHHTPQPPSKTWWSLILSGTGLALLYRKTVSFRTLFHSCRKLST